MTELADVDVPAWWQRLGLPGLFDVHVHFLPPNIQAKVFAQSRGVLCVEIDLDELRAGAPLDLRLF